MSTAPTQAAVFLGVHLAADRANVCAATETGEILCETNAPYAMPRRSAIMVKGVSEMDPEIWWDATRLALGQLVNQLRPKVTGSSQLKAICVCGDPGALLVLDKSGTPLMPAILEDDVRAGDQVTSLNYLGAEHCKKMGVQFRAEFALAKIAWIKENLSELYENAYFAHPTDYILGRLKGGVDCTEYSLAVRTGCDLIDECWPDWLDYDMHLGVRDRLPKLVALGQPVGKVTQKASSLTGLPVGVATVMGTTSDTASFLASGARREGDFYTVLHNGMSISGISPKMLYFANGQIRSFKLPNRNWLFTTESKTGAEWIKVWFNESAFEELEAESHSLLPSDYLAYPNARKGETFPFTSGSAEGFISPATDDRVVQFASCLQGTALFERLCYQKLDKLAGLKSAHGDVYSGGTWSASDPWMQCRADMTGRVNRRMVGRAEAAFGAAMIGAMGVQFKSFEETTAMMLTVEKVFFPNPELTTAYTERFQNFVTLMGEQGYIADK